MSHRRLIARVLAALVLALALPAGAAMAQTASPQQVASSAQHVTLSAPDGRKVDLSVWTAPDERGVVVFSHGHGGQPGNYDRILSAWAAAGFTVVAPLHVDSTAHPDRARFDPMSGFQARLVDLAVTRGFIKAGHPGKPLIVAGHSFGTLLALIQAGAVTRAGVMGDPDVRAVIGFSTAGDLPELVTGETYSTVTAPTLIVTGDADLVPGYVTDWTAHRSAFDKSPAGDKMLLVYDGGDHRLVRDAEGADFDFLVDTSRTFLEAYGLGDAEACARLDALTPPANIRIERR